MENKKYTKEEVEAGLQGINDKLNQELRCGVCGVEMRAGFFEWLEHYKREHPQEYKEIMKV